jgi:hypothetical protein
MKKKDNKLKIKSYRTTSKKCSSCSVVSKDVNMSIIFNKLLCLDCLMLKSISNH